MGGLDERVVWMRGWFDSGAWEVQSREGLSCCLAYEFHTIHYT